MRPVSLSLTLIVLSMMMNSAKNVSATISREQRREMVHDQPLVGGYQSVKNLDDPMVLEAANFALQTIQQQDDSTPNYLFAKQASDVEVVDAYQQVVQGINFQLTLMFMNDNQECVGGCSVSIYNKFGTLSVTNWNKEMTCKQVKTILKEKNEEEGEN